MKHLNVFSCFLFFLGVSSVVLSTNIMAENMLKPPTVEYSATVVRESRGKTIESKIFYTQIKSRTEMEAGGRSRIAIVDRVKGEIISLDPGAKTYFKMESRGDEKDDAPDVNKYTTTLAGHERIDGIDTTKYNYVGTVQGMKIEGTTWVTGDNIPLKTESSIDMNGQIIKSVSQLKNLHVEKQDQALFDLPAGYSAMAVPGMPKRD